MSAFAIYIHLAAQVPYVPRPRMRVKAPGDQNRRAKRPDEERVYRAAYMRARRAGKRDIVV